MTDRVANDSAATRVLGVLDDERYRDLAVSGAAEFQAATPFPHSVIDNFLPAEVATAVARAFPGLDDIDWREIDRPTNRRRYQYDEMRLPPLMREFVREMNSARLLLFLEVLSGIDGLISDPYGLAGGVHMSGRGEFLEIHEDWNWHHKLQLHRRLNALLYLTDPWLPEWGGQLELWEPGGEEAARRIDPIFNRLVVFATEGSRHGHPKPNACPEGTFRRTLNLYYYVSPKVSLPDDPHFTRYAVEQSPLAMSLRKDFLDTSARPGPGPGPGPA